jgi:serine/threonine-protein kinase
VLASVAWLLTSGGAGARPAGGVDGAAYEEYLKGNIEIERYGDLRAVERALQHYRAATGRDARFAPAQAGIAIAYMQKMMYESEPDRYLREASEAAHRAVGLDPGLADGHLAVGRLESFYKWNWVAADQAFARALPLHPSQPFARNYYSAYLTALGRYEEAVAFTRATLALAPHSLSAHTMLAQAYLAAGKAPDAAVVARRALSIDPTFSPMHRFLALAYLETEPARAIEESKTILVPDEANVLAIRAAIAACAGARADAIALRDKLNQLSGVRYVRPTRMAQLESCLGNFDEAFRWLEEGVRDHELDMAMIASFPLLSPLKADPRFAKILASMNLPAVR